MAGCMKNALAVVSPTVGTRSAVITVVEAPAVIARLACPATREFALPVGQETAARFWIA